MRPQDPPPRYAFAYLSPPVSGNLLNGLGEARKVRARHVFHSSGGPPLAWKALDDFFSFINPWGVVRKWYVDFDKCVPYFVKTLGCAICIEVCPWSEPGRGAGLSERMLGRRRARGGRS
jgi:hypothetical protein